MFIIEGKVLWGQKISTNQQILCAEWLCYFAIGGSELPFVKCGSPEIRGFYKKRSIELSL